MKQDLLLIGGGGHCKACIDVIEQTEQFRIIGIIDQPEKVGKSVLNYPILDSDANLSQFVNQVPNCLITVGQIRTPAPRIKLANRLTQLGFRFPTILSPTATVSRHARLGSGTIVMHHSLINAGSQVGRFCIINSSAVLEHDSRVGDYCHISTRAILNGGVEVGAESFVGSGTVTHEYITLGPRSLIGAGLCLNHHLGPDTLLKRVNQDG